MIVPYRAFPTADGWLVVAAGNDKLFRKLCAALGHAEWADDARFTSNAQRVVNRTAIDALIGDAMAPRPSAHWQAVLGAADVPFAAVQTVAQAIGHPQTEAIGMLQPVPDSGMRLVAAPVRFDGDRPAIRRAAPALGADAALLDEFRSDPDLSPP
jgi:crotonobetainyl-CoA:carnitine CoA-transferase CaiB-like acyl-CoA transferase